MSIRAALHAHRTAAKTPHEQTALDRQFAATDSQNDRRVYVLSVFTDTEIAVIESAP